MAELCLQCWNKLNGTSDPESKYIISKDLELCEECGQLTHVIVVERKSYYLHKFRFVILPFKIIYLILLVLCRILILPYLLYKYKKEKS